ncbi:hypothetical protein BCR36DRAFT_31242 [Piromyces finnis]|uniref:Uncharacterized protein n=1 Tax=Piromyces finnis TaxID=1754191 RepID=A0A1Y1VC57_9FUNG|nr:hypothetical protein BCR36DRAFT_31242 [Piromyces finnis]|eukprot:ORX52552.1 hypothetical protein BCR36DRAFT_31242 [Piromyces finnis]
MYLILFHIKERILIFYYYRFITCLCNEFIIRCYLPQYTIRNEVCVTMLLIIFIFLFFIIFFFILKNFKKLILI